MKMKKAKQKKLEVAGWRVGDAKEFLGLSEDELALVELKRALVRMVRETRQSSEITQEGLAKMIDSSQSRIAKLEAASPDVTLDLIFKALFALGVTLKEVGHKIVKETH